MNPPSVDIKDMLEADDDLSLLFKDNLFIGREPDMPDSCVTIFDTPGFPPTVAYHQGENEYFYPSVQIRVRDASYLDGWDLIDKIKTSLHNRANEMWDGTLYCSVVCSGEPALLDWDQKHRARFVTTFNIQRR